jgi:hypothetical protein
VAQRGKQAMTAIAPAVTARGGAIRGSTAAIRH